MEECKSEKEVTEVVTLHDLTIACDDGRYTDACDMIHAAPHLESTLKSFSFLCQRLCLNDAESVFNFAVFVCVSLCGPLGNNKVLLLAGTERVDQSHKAERWPGLLASAGSTRMPSRARSVF